MKSIDETNLSVKWKTRKLIKEKKWSKDKNSKEELKKIPDKSVVKTWDFTAMDPIIPKFVMV